MKVSLLVVLLGLALVHAASRSKRAAYDLPAGAELLVGKIETTFECIDDGYYADQDNLCQIFHVCHTVERHDGTFEGKQWSFLCGNQTVFNQFSFTCSSPEDAIPCKSADEFFGLNDIIFYGLRSQFHEEEDIIRADDIKKGRTYATKILRPPPTSPQTIRPPPTRPPPRPSPPTNFQG